MSVYSDLHVHFNQEHQSIVLTMKINGVDARLRCYFSDLLLAFYV